ncbi:thaumatin domain-containing protein [Legionella steelei]|uniref:Thaumatin domain-containing protein n=2 Tax=Legionella steelei TaxID=947033 RepID=A0A0W0ZGR1_9GAMM|nr:thaumatin domain-containing protein [Legionella steelei]
MTLKIYGKIMNKIKAILKFNFIVQLLCIFTLCNFFNVIYAKNKSSKVQSRAITFVNNCSQPVWFGLISGSVQNTHPAHPGDTSCNSNSDCYTGSVCTQTGAIKQCFWQVPIPANTNYQLAANGGTNTVTIPIYSNQQNVIWSGAIAGRTQCANGACQTADCGSGVNGCKEGVGFQQPATQAEFTFLKNGPDYYDVEIINGFNLPVSMTPKNTSSNTNTAPYTCGSPGAATQTNSLLGACSWTFNPPSNDYRWVAAGGGICNVDSDCPSSSTCGISFNPGKNPLLKKSCGTLLGYWTADQICGLQPNYGAPFNCAQKLPAPQDNLTLWNLYACTNVGSCYSQGASNNCCGCVDWDKTGIEVPPAPYTNQCNNTNMNWNNYVQPTLSWLKAACPTAYVYPFDDMSSTFTCANMQNNVNVENYTITYCPGSSNTPPPPSTSYNYNVYIGYPFKAVLINNSITCPDPTNKSPVCLIQNQKATEHMTIKGSNAHLCDLTINNDGSLTVNAGSNGCYINSSPATSTKPGTVNLPSNF